MKMNENYDVFISYRREDGAIFAESIAHSLRERGYSVFFDKNDLKMGDQFPKELEMAIDNAKEFVAIVSESYFGKGKRGIRIKNSGDWIHKEVLYALQNSEINFLPVLVGANTPTSEELPKDIEKVCLHNFYIYNNQYDTVEKLVGVLIEQFHLETNERAATGKIIKAIKGVDVHDNKEFNVLCKKIINNLSSDMDLKALQHILNKKNEGNDSNYYDSDYRFVAFYVLFSYYRRMHYINYLVELVEEYWEEFSGYNFFYYSMTEYYTLKFYLAHSRKDEEYYLKEMLNYSELAIKKIEENNGIIHSYCLSVAIASENGISVDATMMKKALELIDKIIKADVTYARYYATKAKLLACESMYDEALKNIRYAQTIERPNYNDWMLRISEYNKEECIIRMKKIESE